MDFCMMAMPMFFLVSGYLLFQNYSWGGYCKIIAVLAVALACCADVLRDDAVGPMPLLRFFGTPLFVVLGIGLSKLHRLSTIVEWLVPTSFLIYLGHGILNPCFMHSMGSVIPCCLGKMSVIAIMTMVATISVMVLTWYVMNRRCPRLLRVLDGRW